MKSGLNNILQLRISLRFHLLFALSMLIYHSTEYFTTLNPTISNIEKSLSLVTSINATVLKLVGILASIFVTATFFIKTLWKKNQNYLLQISQKLIFPIQVYVAIQLLKKSASNESYSAQNSMLDYLFYALTIANLIVIIVKNLKLSLRYEIPEKGFNKINNQLLYILFVKMAINLIFSVYIPSHVVSFVIVTSLANLTGNWIYFRNVIYENPKIEYLEFITQIYQWIPLLSIVTEYFHLSSPQSLFIVNLLKSVIYVALCIGKPKVMVQVLERKYLRCAQKLKSLSLSKKKSQLQSNILPILSIYMDVFFNQSSQQLQLSDTFKSSLIQFFKKNPQSNQSQYSSNKSIRLISVPPFRKSPLENLFEKSSASTTNEPYSKSIQSKKAVENMHSNESRQSFESTESINEQISDIFAFQDVKNSKNKQVLFQLIWNMVLPYLTDNNHSYNNLRSYVCFNFPDHTEYMKYRLIHTYYFNKFENTSFFSSINFQFCQIYLLKKIGRINIIHQAEHIQRNDKNLLQTLCLFKQSIHQHMKFNDILKQTEIRQRLLSEVKNFCLNEKKYLDIFDNIKEKKHYIILYYKKRCQIRQKIKFWVDTYQQLKYRNSMFIISANYVNDYFINKNYFLAFENFNKYFEQNSAFSKQDKRIFEDKNAHKEYRQKEEKKIFNPAQSYKIQCTVSGLKNMGKIIVSTSKFKKMMQINQKCETQSQQFSIIDINNLMLPLWKDRHKEVVKDYQVIDKPFHHMLKSYYMLSHRRTNLMKIRFQMYFFMKFEEDLLLVLDFEQFDKIDQLVIRNTRKQTIFKYPLSNHLKPLYTKADSSASRIESQTMSKISAQKKKQARPYKVYIFGAQYYIHEKITQQIQNLSEDLSHKISKSICLDQIRGLITKPTKRVLSITRQKQIEKDFIAYKKNFKILKRRQKFLTISIFISIIFVWALFYSWIIIEEQSEQVMMTAIEEKGLLLAEFISDDLFDFVDVQILYSLSKNFIRFRNNDQKQEFSLGISILDSEEVTDNEIQSRYSIFNSPQRPVSYRSIILDGNSVKGFTKSFIFRYMQNDIRIVENLNTLMNLQEFKLKTKGARCSKKDKQCLQMLKQALIIPQNISTIKQYEIQNYRLSFLRNNRYLFSEDGFVKKINDKEQKIFTLAFLNSLQILIVLQVGFFIFIFLITYQLVNIKKKMLENFNHAVRVSPSFLTQFQKDLIKLNTFQQKLDKNNENEAVKYIKSNNGSNSQRMTRKRTKSVMSKIDFSGIFFSKLSLTDHNFNEKTKKNIQESSQLHSSNDILDSLHSFIPPFKFIFVIAICLIVLNSSLIKIKDLKEYSYNMGDFLLLKNSMIEAMTLVIAENSNKQLGIIQPEIMQGLDQCLHRLKQANKLQLIKRMFPFNPQILDDVSYYPASTLGLDLSSSRIDRDYSLIEVTTKLYLNFEQLYQTLELPNPNPTLIRNKIQKVYFRIVHFLQIMDLLDGMSEELVRVYLAFDYYNYMIAVLFFLTVEFAVSYLYLQQSLRIFHEEFLNLGSANQLGEERGFSLFVNLAGQKDTLPTSQSSAD